jgi:hypothetical protein
MWWYLTQGRQYSTPETEGSPLGCVLSRGKKVWCQGLERKKCPIKFQELSGLCKQEKKVTQEDGRLSGPDEMGTLQP